jgi:HSP20 family molecular chaperone IbpA
MSDKDDEETAEKILNSLGFGDLVDLLKQSDVFGERMDEVNKKIKERLDSEDLEDVKPKFDYNFSINTLEDSSKRRSKPRKGSRPKKGDESSSWNKDSTKYREGQKENKKKRERGEAQKSEPLVDLFEEEDQLRVVAMFHGVDDPEDLELELKGEALVLKTPDNRKEVELPYPVSENPSVDYKNGIFDIKYERN